jgi:hypothetical protein
VTHPELEEALEGAGGAFFAKFGETTSAELKEAYEAGKAVFCSNGNGVTSLVMARTGLGLYIFTAISDANLVQHTCSNDVWSETTESYAAAVHASEHINLPGVFQGSDPLTPAMIGALAAPTPTASDNKKVLTVVNGAPAWAEAGGGLPEHSSSDNGKFLRIVNGAPAWATVQNAEEVSF